MQALNCKQVVPSAHSAFTPFTCTHWGAHLHWFWDDNKGQLFEGVGCLNYFPKPLRSEWVSKLTLIQRAEMAIVSAHSSKQTELRSEVFLWIQITLSFFYLTFFYGLHCSIPYKSQQQDLFVTTHCTRTITLGTDSFSSSDWMLLFMQEKMSLTTSALYIYILPVPTGIKTFLTPVLNYCTFLMPITHLI